ncbi:MAG: flagellar hook-basal body complex protein FliE [Syntrophomonadaceae bacterium]|jgi:flagellar hook-basal body complex protein FliE|nr:flagellar hook-basal body complex protein FliE [Syntrophomonadaceae bacterium]
MISSAFNILNLGASSAQPDAAKAENLAGKEASFTKYLSDALNNLNALQQNASDSATQMVMGSDDYLHNVILAYEKADLAFKLTVEVRNKCVEAYQEIMRMQL